MYFYRDKFTDEIIISKDKIEEDLEELIPNVEDAAFEKHIPDYAISLNNKIVVKVGSVLHPMTDDHYIKWIALISGEDVIRKYYFPGDEPIAVFDKLDGNMTIYAYCNKHGLWKKDIEI